MGVTVVLYFVKSSLFEGAIQKVLDLLAIANHFDNFVGGILDVTGIVYMLSVICNFCISDNSIHTKTALELILEVEERRKCRYERK